MSLSIIRISVKRRCVKYLDWFGQYLGLGIPTSTNIRTRNPSFRPGIHPFFCNSKPACMVAGLCPPRCVPWQMRLSFPLPSLKLTILVSLMCWFLRWCGIVFFACIHTVWTCVLLFQKITICHSLHTFCCSISCLAVTQNNAAVERFHALPQKQPIMLFRALDCHIARCPQPCPKPSKRNCCSWWWRRINNEGASSCWSSSY